MSSDLGLARRSFLQYLAASPLLRSEEPDVITDPLQAINIMDFEPPARKILPPAHYGYMATGVEDDLTLKANRSGFTRFYLRPRRLIDITKVDTSIELFGRRWDSPVALAPVGNMMAFHAEGEMPVARAARDHRHASDPVDDGEHVHQQCERGTGATRVVPALYLVEVGRH
jgi:4-hydroxymandelate oxidase